MTCRGRLGRVNVYQNFSAGVVLLAVGMGGGEFRERKGLVNHGLWLPSPAPLAQRLEIGTTRTYVAETQPPARFASDCSRSAPP